MNHTSGAEGVGRVRRRIARPDIVVLVFCAASIAYLAWGSTTKIKRRPQSVSALVAENPAEPALAGSGFAPDAVYPTTTKPSMDGSLSFYGSWLGTDASTGSVHTQWYRPEPEFYVFVCGYPNRPGNRLFMEVETTAIGIARIPVSPDQDPAEYWSLKRVSLAKVKAPKRVRLVASDGSTLPGGWIGFSQPFVTPRGLGRFAMKELLLVILCAATSFVALLSPGLVLRQLLRRYYHRRLQFVWLPFPGVLALATIGLVAWLGPEQFNSRLICKVGLWLLVTGAIYSFIRTPLSNYTTATERRVLLVAVVLASIGVAKATYSLGPPGELFGDTISRTLEVGGRSDSRLPYHVVQLVAAQGQPFGPLGKYLYWSYGVFNFSHRGALTALAVSPLVLVGPVRVPAIMPDQPWTVFDPEGFSAFRIAAIVMAACGLVAVFGVSRLFFTERWALLAFLVAVTAPFVVHEVYFTWPKLEAASFAFLAAYLVLRRRQFMAGLALGLGYLCHPSALLAGPSLVGVIFLPLFAGSRRSPSVLGQFYRSVVRSAALVAGSLIGVLVWRLVNGRHFEQGMFLSYFVRADGGPRTAAYWVQLRLDSLWKTLVPLHTFLYHRMDNDATSVSGPTSAAVSFFLQYWTTLPFGVGIGYFCCLLRLLWAAFVIARAWLLLVFCAPFLIFVAYWGVPDTGLLREGLHAWFLGLMVFSVYILRQLSGRHQLLWKLCNWALLLRALEILAMLLLPTIRSQPSLTQGRFVLSDTIALVTMLAGSIWLCFSSFLHAERLRAAAKPVSRA